MKSVAVIFILIIHFAANSQVKLDTLLLVKVECYLNDTILESGSNYEYDDNLNQIKSVNWSNRNRMIFNNLTYNTYDTNDKLIKMLTYADSVLRDSAVFYYLNNSLESSYQVSYDLNDSRITRTLFSDFEKPIREEIQSVYYEYGLRKEQTFLNTFVYNSLDYLIEVSRYEIGSKSIASRPIKIGEIDTIDYTDSLISRTRYQYNKQNQLIVEKHFMINDIHTRTKLLYYNPDGLILKEDNWYSHTDSITTSYACIFSEEDGLKCSSCDDFTFVGTKFTRKLNDKEQLIEETHGGNDLMTVRIYEYNENGRLISELETVSFKDEITKRETLYTYQLVSH